MNTQETIAARNGIRFSYSSMSESLDEQAFYMLYYILLS